MFLSSAALMTAELGRCAIGILSWPGAEQNEEWLQTIAIETDLLLKRNLSSVPRLLRFTAAPVVGGLDAYIKRSKIR